MTQTKMDFVSNLNKTTFFVCNFTQFYASWNFQYRAINALFLEEFDAALFRLHGDLPHFTEWLLF